MSTKILTIEKWYEVKASDGHSYRTKGDGKWEMLVNGSWRKVGYSADIEKAFRSKLLENA
jgi:hypothetical protein